MPKRRPYENADMVVARLKKNKDVNRRWYSINSLVDLLNAIPFNLVNIPLYTYNCLVYNNDNRPGNTVCGYVAGYDQETDSFNVVIHEKFVDIIDSYENPIIYIRPLIDQDGNVTKIKGFDICPNDYYRFIR